MLSIRVLEVYLIALFVESYNKGGLGTGLVKLGEMMIALIGV